MGEENHIKDLGQEGNRLLEALFGLQDPVRAGVKRSQNVNRRGERLARPLSVSLFLRLTASLGSVTDT